MLVACCPGMALGPHRCERWPVLAAAAPQAWEEAAAKAGLAGPEELGAEGRWAAGVALIGAWGDPDAMARWVVRV